MYHCPQLLADQIKPSVDNLFTDFGFQIGSSSVIWKYTPVSKYTPVVMKWKPRDVLMHLL